MHTDMYLDSCSFGLLTLYTRRLTLIHLCSSCIYATLSINLITQENSASDVAVCQCGVVKVAHFQSSSDGDTLLLASAQLSDLGANISPITL